MDFRINKKKWYCICELYPCAQHLDNSIYARNGKVRDFSSDAGLEKISIFAINRNKCYVLSMKKNGKDIIVHDLEEAIQEIKEANYFIDPRSRLWRLTFTTMIIFAIFVHAFHHIKAIWLRKKS